MKQVLKRVWIWLGLLLSLCVIPAVYSISEDSKVNDNNISGESREKYEASVSDVIEQKLFLYEPLESLSLYMSLEENKINKNENNLQNAGNGDITRFVVQIIGLETEEEQELEFSSGVTENTLIIPIGKHNDKNKWVTVRITVQNIQEGSTLNFYFNSPTESVKNVVINGVETTKGLCIKYVQKTALSTMENILIILAVLFLVVFSIWYSIKNKDNKLNLVLFFVLLLMELLFLNFYKNYVYSLELYYINKFYYIVVGMLFAVILGLFWILKRKVKLEWITTYCLFGFGLVYLMILPAFSAPDEPDHFVSAYKLSNQMFFQEPMDEQGNVLVRIGDSGNFDVRPGRKTYKEYYGNLFNFSNNEATLVPQGDAAVAEGGIIAHLPGAIGITIARLLKLNKSMLLILGRLMGLVFYCFCLYWAVKKMPFGKMILFVISMFPMMLEQSASFGYDLVLNGLSFFVIAYISNLIYEKKQVSVKDIVIVCLALFGFAPCKVVYILIAGMWILIPKEKFKHNKLKEKRFKFISIIAVFLSVLLPNILINLTKVSDISSDTSVIFWAGERGYGIGDILANVPYSFCVFVKTIIKNGEFYLKTLVGQQLGWIEIPVSWFIIVGFLVIFVLEVFRVKGQYVIKPKERICYGCIAAVVSLMVIAIMWIAWTPISYEIIEGVQGRYFIPIVPLIYLAVANNKQIKIKSSVNMNIILLCLLNVYAILDVLQTTFSR